MAVESRIRDTVGPHLLTSNSDLLQQFCEHLTAEGLVVDLLLTKEQSFKTEELIIQIDFFNYERLSASNLQLKRKLSLRLLSSVTSYLYKRNMCFTTGPRDIFRHIQEEAKTFLLQRVCNSFCFRKNIGCSQTCFTTQII